MASSPQTRVARVVPSLDFAMFGYRATPEVIPLAVWVTYVVVVLWLYLRPDRSSSVAVPSDAAAAETGGPDRAAAIS